MCDVPTTLPESFIRPSVDQMVLNNSNEIVNCWLDCDPGHDDALAIILACFNTKINLIGISTIGGNQIVEKTTHNALNVLNIVGMISSSGDFKEDIERELKLSDSFEFGGLKVPVIRGCSKSLIKPSLNCGEIHGESGLEGSYFPTIPENAVKFTKKISEQTKHFTTCIYEHFKASNSPVTVITTGPMTNIALLLLNYPNVTKYISKIVFMGGACGIGNITPTSEFNILVDPEATHIIFESDIPIYMVPLEVTHTLLVTPKILSKIRELNTKFSETIINLLLFFTKTYEDVFGFHHPPLHDPAAVAFVINPDLFYYRLMRVDVELHSSLCSGQTVCDIYNMSSKKKNVHVCLRINIETFWDLLCEAIIKANKNSPLTL